MDHECDRRTDGEGDRQKAVSNSSNIVKTRAINLESSIKFPLSLLISNGVKSSFAILSSY